MAKRSPKRGARLSPTKSSGKKSARSNSARQRSRSNRPNKDSCPIVGIGGSAGGFEAAMELLRNLPPSTGMAFVIVQHLDPHHASRLSKLLSKVTAMPVVELAEPTTPQPNAVYVQPPNKCVIVKSGALRLIRRTQQLNLAIDHFFESLAQERGSRAIGVNTRERKVTDREGRDYSLRVRPYRTTDNKIDGAVITLVDLEGRKESDAGKTPKRAKQIFSHK